MIAGLPIRTLTSGAILPGRDAVLVRAREKGLVCVDITHDCLCAGATRLCLNINVLKYCHRIALQALVFALAAGRLQISGQ